MLHHPHAAGAEHGEHLEASELLADEFLGLQGGTRAVERLGRARVRILSTAARRPPPRTVGLEKKW